MGYSIRRLGSQFLYFAVQSFFSESLSKLSDRVDYWIIFNEPAVYASLTHINGTWPTALVGFSMFDQRYYNKALHNMAESQKYLYKAFHEMKPGVKVGVAKYITKITQKNYSRLNQLFLGFLSGKMNYGFIDTIADHLDFIGVNYYGKEVIEGFGSIIDSNTEYSEAGRAVDPSGLYEILKYLDTKYNKEQEETSILDNRKWHIRRDRHTKTILFYRASGRCTRGDEARN